MRGNILVTGANGQLGRELGLLSSTLGDCSFYYTDSQVLDISNPEAVNSFCKKNQINVIINCAAYTNVDKAEDDFDRANQVNNLGVRNLASAAVQFGAKLVHISTDYVFGGDGNTPYTEDMPVAPLGVYGKTKLLGEEGIAEIMGKDGNYVIIRTAWLYSPFGNNFVKTMRRLTSERDCVNVVFDQVGTPTYAADLAQAIIGCAELQGLYHFSNEGVCSWYDFAIEIARLSGNEKCKICPCHSDEFPSKVTRPPYSVLDKTKIKRDLGIGIPHWKDSLARCLERISKYELQ